MSSVSHSLAEARALLDLNFIKRDRFKAKIRSRTMLIDTSPSFKEREKLVQILHGQRLACTSNCTKQESTFPSSTSTKYETLSNSLSNEILISSTVLVYKHALISFSEDWKILLVETYKELAFNKKRIPRTEEDISHFDWTLPTKAFFDRYSRTDNTSLLNRESFVQILLEHGNRFQNVLGTRCYHSAFDDHDGYLRSALVQMGACLYSDQNSAIIKDIYHSVLSELTAWRMEILQTQPNWEPVGDMTETNEQNGLRYLTSQGKFCQRFLQFMFRKLQAEQLYSRNMLFSFIPYSDGVLLTRAAIFLFSCSVPSTISTQQPSHLYKYQLLHNDPFHWYRYIMTLQALFFDVTPETFETERFQHLNFYSNGDINHPNFSLIRSTKSKYKARQARKKSLARFNNGSLFSPLETISIVNLTTAQLTSLVEDLSISSSLNAVEEVETDVSDEAELNGVDELKEDEWIPELIDGSESQDD